MGFYGLISRNVKKEKEGYALDDMAWNACVDRDLPAKYYYAVKEVIEELS